METNPFASVEQYFDEPSEKVQKLCPDCGGPIEIRNPTGKCDHLYYPERKQKRLGPEDAEDLVITQEQKLKICLDYIRDQEKEYGDCKFDEVWGCLCKIGITDIGAAHEVIEKLKQGSHIYEPRHERYKVV